MTAAPRARDLGLGFPGRPGALNAITDVAGVTVGYATLIRGDGPLVVGKGPVRTGVTAILPRPAGDFRPCFAGVFSLNGNGEMTGAHFIEEAGRLALPITITNTHSCGLARDATIRWAASRFPGHFDDAFGLPVAAETYDGYLNDINGFHVTEADVLAALDAARAGPVAEGSLGGGTGMKCFGFKAGSGTASRRVALAGQDWTLGLFVQANFGAREDFTLLGRPLGRELADPPAVPEAKGSIIAVVATDAPLLPHQLKRLARRVGFGIGRTGGHARHGSGDIFLAFSTADAGPARPAAELQSARYLPDEHLDPMFLAVVEATEEAIVNAMVAARSMTGRDGHVVPGLPLDRVVELMALPR